MPTITASTITLMPEETTLPSTRSARKLVRFHKAKGTRMKPARARQLELDDRDEQLHREDEEGEDDEQPGEQQHRDRQEILEEGDEPDELADLVEQRPRRIEAGRGDEPGFRSSSALIAPPPAVIPSPAKDLKMMSASVVKLPMMKAKAPT